MIWLYTMGMAVRLQVQVFCTVSASRVGEDRITWQPEPGIRSAVVVVHYTGATPGYVMAGRSLREVEWRIDRLSGQYLR